MRKIIHIDMDCFYAAVEVRDDPSLVGKSVAVGGSSDRRGVLCTANYEARGYGVRSAMATARAFQLCPKLVLLPVRMRYYREISQQIRHIFADYTDLIEPLSLDEAYLDVSDSKRLASDIASEIRGRIASELQLTASAGVSCNKFLAKVASDWRKPNGQFVVPPQRVEQFVAKLPVKKIFGVGKVTQEKLQRLGVEHCADLQKLPLMELIERFGKFGVRLYDLARGVDRREVNPERVRKSVSVEHTFAHDLVDLAACEAELPALIAALEKRLMNHAGIHKVCVKIKFSDFTQTTVECVANEMTPSIIRQLLVKGFSRQRKPVRLLGLGVGLREARQAVLF